MGYLTNFREKKWFLTFFYCEVENFFFNFAFFSFLYVLFINKARKPEIAECNPIMEVSPFSLSVRVPFLLFPVHVFLSLTLYLSLSLFVDAAFQLLLCGIMSSSLILINHLAIFVYFFFKFSENYMFQVYGSF